MRHAGVRRSASFFFLNLHNHPFIRNKQTMQFQPARSPPRSAAASISALQSICVLSLCGATHTHTHTHTHTWSTVCQWAAPVWECHLYSHHQIHPGGCPHQALLIYHRLARGDDGNWFYWGLPLDATTPSPLLPYSSASTNSSILLHDHGNFISRKTIFIFFFFPHVKERGWSYCKWWVVERIRW